MKRWRIAMVAVVAMAAVLAVASDEFMEGAVTCSAAQPLSSAHRPESELRHKLLAQGWTILALHQGDDCYEVHGANPRRERVLSYFDPVTLDMVREVKAVD